MKYRIAVLGVLSVLSLSVLGQGRGVAHRMSVADSLEAVIKSYSDSLAQCRNTLDSLRKFPRSKVAAGAPDGRYAQLFVPLVFSRGVAARQFSFGEDAGSSLTDAALLNVYLHRPDLVKGKEYAMEPGEQAPPTPPVAITPVVMLEEDLPVGTVTPDLSAVNVVVRRPNFWKISGDYNLQMFQNYVSTNWYKGGESSYSLMAALTLQANYNNKQKVKWDNKLEMRLGFQNTRSDTLHAIKTSEDLLRYTGKLGLQASRQWYYTVQLIAYTQFMRGYKSNDPMVYSDFGSPLNVNLSVGMDYGVKWLNERLTGSIHLAPLAYNFKYVGRKSLITRYGLDEGHHTFSDFGSEFTVDLTWKFSDIISWKTRLYGFTSYERAELEWENTFVFQLTKYLSSNFFVYPRFDDGVLRGGHHGYWQLKEYLSIGFNYSF